MSSEFSAREVAVCVLEHLERRRPAIAADAAQVQAEVKEALVPLRKAYAEAELPLAYFDALEHEVEGTLPARWQSAAIVYTDLEAHDFYLWRKGDPVSRLTYVFAGLTLGGICVALPFIPIWSDWFPFILAFAAWWLPTLQVAWYKRRYARALGDMVVEFAKVQPQLDAHFESPDLLLPRGGQS